MSHRKNTTLCQQFTQDLIQHAQIKAHDTTSIIVISHTTHIPSQTSQTHRQHHTVLTHTPHQTYHTAPHYSTSTSCSCCSLAAASSVAPILPACNVLGADQSLRTEVYLFILSPQLCRLPALLPFPTAHGSFWSAAGNKQVWHLFHWHQGTTH